MACTNFDIGLHRIDAESVLRGTVLKFRKAEPLSTTDFVQHFFTNLKGTNLFNLESEAEYVSLSKVFEDYIKTSRILKDTQKEQLLAEYAQPLGQNFGLSPEATTIEVADKDLIIPDAPENINNEVSNSEKRILTPSLNDTYGSATVVKEYMLNQFRYNIIESSLVNFTDGKLIKTTDDLNIYIAKYKNTMFKNLVDYIKMTNEEDGITTDFNMPNAIYIDGTPDVEGMQKVLRLADELFKDMPRSKLDNAYVSRKQKFGDLYKNQMLIDAFNAWAVLSNGNFDTILKNLFGKNMEIKNKGYIGIEIPVSVNKYQFRAGSNMVKTWRTNENVDAISEIGNVSRLLIEQTPVLNFTTGEQIRDNYLTLKQFLHSMNKLKDEANFLYFGDRLQELVTNFHSAPNYYLKRILEEIINNGGGSRIFQINDLNVFKSIYEKFYNDSRANSLYNIINNDYKQSKAITTYDLLDSISGVVDRTNNAKYIQYAMNQDTNDLDSMEIKQTNVNRRKIQRENDIDISNELRGNRQELLDKWGVEVHNATLGDISFKLPYNGDTITLIYNRAAIGSKGQKKLELSSSDKVKYGSLDTILKEPSFTTLKAIYEENNPQTITPQERLYVSLVEFMDDFINTRFLNGNIDLLAAFKNVKEADNLKYLTENLMSLANSSAFVNTVYNEFETNNPDNLDLYSFIKTLKYYTDKVDEDSPEARFYYDKSSNSLKAIDGALINTLNDLVAAEQIVTGEIFKSVIKNAEGNNIPNSRIANLAGLTRRYVTRTIIENPNSSLKNTLFGLNPGMLRGTSIKTDVVSRTGVKKSATSFSVAEIGYSSILYDFYANLLRKVDKGQSKTINVQPTVYSDKGTFVMWTLTADGIKLVDENGEEFTIDLLNSSISDLNKAIRSTVGSYYKNTFNNVLNDYRNVYRGSLDTFLQRLQENGLTDAYNSIVGKQAAVDAENAKIEAHNAKLAEEVAKQQALADAALQAGDYMEIDAINNYILTELQPKEPIDLVDKMTFKDFQAILSVTTKGEYGDMSYRNGVPNIDNVHVNKGGSFVLNGNKKGGLSSNALLNFNANELYAKEDVYNKMFLREKKKFVKDMIDNNMTFPLRYANGRVNSVLNKALNTLIPTDKASWINNDTQELILAKQGDKVLSRLSDLDSTWLRNDEDITLNPILERYFLADFLTSENLRLVTTGSSIAHPNKAKYGKVNPASFNGIELEQSSRELAELKRNVIIPGTLQYFQQNSLLGIPKTYRLAIMSDVAAFVYNFKGETSTVDAHDGSAFCNPIMSYLENFSLQDSAVGDDKKPIGHDFNGDYGTASLLKFATFSTYNERMRNSMKSDISLYNMFRKMSDFKWNQSTNQFDNAYEGIDLTKNIFGNTMELKDVTGGERIFYRDGNNHYEILGLDRVGDGLYNIRTQAVNEYGNPVKAVGDANVMVQLNVPINSLFELHAALGGVYSESLRNGELAYSDASLAVTANYANNVGWYRPNGEIPSQRNTIQPLKHKMIAYLVNKSAIKVGAQNINGDSSWFDNSPLMEMEFNTEGLGIQMDADHVVTDPEHQSTMTEFSQVISALEAMGFTHSMAKMAYKDLGRVALSSIGGIRDAVYTLVGIKPTDNPDVKSGIYEIVGKAIIKELNKDGDELGTAKTIIEKAKAEFALDRKNNNSHGTDVYKIPYSDPSIFGKTLSSFTSNINKTAIKRKFPGMGAVMAPAYNIVQQFRIGGTNYKYDDIYRIASEQGMTPDEYLQSEQAKIEAQPASTIDRLLPGDRIKLPIQEVASVVARISQNALDKQIALDLAVKRTLTELEKAQNGDGEGVEIAKAQDNYDKAVSAQAKNQANSLMTVDQYLADKGWSIEGSYVPVYVNDFDTYNLVKANFSQFYTDITRPTDLKPAEIYWEDMTGMRHSIFDMPAIQRSFSERTKYDGGKLPKALDSEIQAQIQATFTLLDNGYMPVTGIQKAEYLADPVAFSDKYAANGYIRDLGNGDIAIPIQNLVNNPAELSISKLYVDQFNLGPNDSINDVLTQGYQFFVNRYDKYHAPKIKWYDMMFTRANGKHVYVALGETPSLMEHLSVNKALTESDFVRVGNSVMRVDENGEKMYEAGFYDESGEYHEVVTSYNALGNNTTEEVLVAKTPDSVIDIYGMDSFDSVKINQYTKNKEMMQRVIEAGSERNDRLLKLLFDTYKENEGEEFSVSRLAYQLDGIEKNQKIIDAKKKFVSFQKSLEFTVARIPAQTMQSFMKMKAVAFNDSDKNVVHVSHWQTWLQGSDYDIDKAYIMGYDFDTSGHYVGWSPYFNFNSIESLKASEMLPTPNGKLYAYGSGGVDITNYLNQLNRENFYNPESVPVIAEMLNAIDDARILTYSGEVDTDNANFILNRINNHTMYMTEEFDENGKKARNGRQKIRRSNLLPAFRNSVSSKISNIIQNLKNMNQAYSPIEMGDPQRAAKESASGQEANKITMTSPSSKWVMQMQNMDGKQVIGIAAVGEKVFFANCYYFNEGVRNGDQDWLDNMFFSTRFEGIQTMLSENDKPITVPTLRNIMANVNFDDLAVKKDYWRNLIVRAVEQQLSPEDVARVVQEQLGMQPDQSLVISALLSAATDNAKELILSKINAGPNLAGMYLHMIMLGFSFNDIAKFMTSPTVQTVNDLMKVNVFDEYHDHASVDSVVRALEEGPNIRNYFDSTSLGNFFKRVQEKLLDSGEEAFDKRGNWIQAIKDRFAEGDSIDDIFPAVSYREHRFLEEYKYLQKMKNRLDMDRFAEFKKVNRSARETELLGRFYGLNQGMPTDLGGKMSRLNTYESAITSREQLYKDDKYEKGYNPEVVIKNILNDKPYLSEEQVRAVVNDAVAQGITNGGFSMRKFLDPMNSGYKKSTIAYYNLIKGTWNIFDMIDKIPHFKALFEVYNLTDTTDVNISTKFNLVNSYREALIKENPTYGRAVTKEQLNALGEHVDDVLITGWLAKRNITFRMDEGQKYIGNDMTLHDIKEGGEVFSLATNDGIANFKLWMERTVIPELHNGMVGDKRVRSLLINQFVQGLSRNRRTDPFTRGNTTYMKLPIDMMNVRTESDQAMFSRYQKDFAALKRINLQGLPLTDWFFLYNLVVNKNKYGADRLTTLLNTFDKTDVSDLLIEYQKYVGQSDYDLDVNMDTFSLEDALIRMAPIISESAKGRARDKYIRMRNEETGRLELYERDGEDYYEVNDIPDPSNVDMRRLYDDYFVIRTPNQNAKMKELVLNRNDSMENIVNKIKSLMERNTIQIRINC